MLISIIIPNRESENCYKTLESLKEQIGKDSEVIIIYDEGKGANWARNRGVEIAKGSFLLFSDNDIIWQPYAVETLYWELENYHPEAGYSYGWYQIENEGDYCRQQFSEYLLKKKNYISTMSMIRKEVFTGFDESLQRLQDWDIWLTLLEKGIKGSYCGQHIFTTKKREGITYGNGVSWEEARKIVMEKHKLT